MPRFGKNVLSQYLRTKCDKQLRLSLYKPPELTTMGWPEPLTARPAVQILRDVGDRAKVAAHRDHYCVPNAEDVEHLSRLATISRGGRKTLEQAGHADVTAVSALTPTSAAFEQHNSLKADRNHLPHRATSLVANSVTIAPNTTTIDFPKWADLEIFVTVNFDSGTGLLTAIGSEARFRQRVPFGQPPSQVQRTWPAEAQTLLASTLNEERNVVVSFLSRIQHRAIDDCPFLVSTYPALHYAIKDFDLRMQISPKHTKDVWIIPHCPTKVDRGEHISSLSYRYDSTICSQRTELYAAAIGSINFAP